MQRNGGRDLIQILDYMFHVDMSLPSHLRANTQHRADSPPSEDRKRLYVSEVYKGRQCLFDTEPALKLTVITIKG